ncbi:MAG TPA: hypothetical protein VFE50_09805 [Cyclobacteriaceae bacterium]|nr:hypothetical protein [Cyclobacteriaceae bacterium]
MAGMRVAAQYASMLGDYMDCYIKGGSYKSSGNGKYLQYQVYVKSENKIYSKMAPSDTLYWTDASVDVDPVTDISVSKKSEEVLGLMCDKIVMKTKSAFAEGAKALPLRTVIETPQFTMTSIATEVKAENLKDSDFNLPNLPKKKSPF